MALPAYLTIRGERQGPILGPWSKDGRTGLIQVLAAFHTIVAPRDPRSGRPIGKRVHKPLTIVKHVDVTSPQLYNLICHNESATAELRFYRPNPDGTEFNHLTVTLYNVQLASIVLKLPNVLNRRFSHLGPREEIGLAYGRIEWAATKPATFGADDWETQT